MPRDPLGLDAPITRRDFLNASPLASGAALMTSACPLHLVAEDDWTGVGGVGDYSASNGNTYEVTPAGHKIRDRVYEPLPRDIMDTGGRFDCVIVGAGISGPAAALFFSGTPGTSKSVRLRCCV